MDFRLWDYAFYPRAVWRFREFLEQSQRWDRERRRRWLQEQLDRTLWHAVRNVPYYARTLGPHRDRFGGMIERMDLSDLPLLTKDLVRRHASELRSANVNHREISTVFTSGTTGSPTAFLVDRQSNVAQFASLWRVLNWAGYRFGDRFVDIRRNPIEASPIRRDLRLNSLVFSVFHFKKENTGLYLRSLKRFRPVLLKAYPSAIYLLCRWIQEAGGTEYRPPAVLTCAETLLDHQRAAVQDVFGCPHFDFYNHNERAGLISTCSCSSYHIHEEYSFMEFIAGEGGPDGVQGEIVTTTLHNRIMPLIRYQTGDLAGPDPGGTCGCGRTNARVSRIHGRITDVIVTPEGRCLSGLEHAFMRSPGISTSQVIQEEVGEVCVRIVKGERYSPVDAEKVHQRLREILGSGMSIRFDFVPDIPPGPNGKRQFVVSAPARRMFAGGSRSCAE